jgi:hypothetical protein
MYGKVVRKQEMDSYIELNGLKISRNKINYAEYGENIEF